MKIILSRKQWKSMNNMNQWIKVAQANNLIFYRTEPIDPTSSDKRFNWERVERIKNSIGQQYPENFGKNFIPCTNNKEMLKAYIKNQLTTGYAKFGLNKDASKQVVIEFTADINGVSLDEAIVVNTFLLTDFNYQNPEPYRIQERKKAFIKEFGNGVKKYLTPDIFDNKSFIASLLPIDRLTNIRKTIATKGEFATATDDMDKIFISARSNPVLAELAQKIKTDPEIMQYYTKLQNKNGIESDQFQIFVKYTKVINAYLIDKNSNWIPLQNVKKEDFYDKKEVKDVKPVQQVEKAAYFITDFIGKIS